MKIYIYNKNHGKCPHCGQKLGPPGSEHTCG